jgi:RHS repeat-associated protein
LFTSRSGTLNGLPATSTSYMHQDHLSSVSVITDETGVVVERLAYDPWGKRRKIDGTRDKLDILVGVRLDRGYTMHEHLDEVGIIHMNGRIYDPLIGRFMSADPYVQAPTNLKTFNRYSYVWNNPLKMYDPEGFTVEDPQKDQSTWGMFVASLGSGASAVWNWLTSSSGDNPATGNATTAPSSPSGSNSSGSGAETGGVTGTTITLPPVSISGPRAPAVSLPPVAVAASPVATFVILVAFPSPLADGTLDGNRGPDGRVRVPGLLAVNAASDKKPEEEVKPPDTMGTPPGGPDDPNKGDIQKKSDAKLKKDGIDAEAFKKDMVGDNGGKFNIAVDKTTGEVYLTPVRRGTGEPIRTGYQYSELSELYPTEVIKK